MQTIFFSASSDTIQEWQTRDTNANVILCYDLESLQEKLQSIGDNSVVIADYDSVAQEINKLITSNQLPKFTIVLEKVPEIASGRMLVKHGVKAYGNSRMLTLHYTQMLETVINDKVWTYPELTAVLAQATQEINPDAKELLEHRLSQKELEVVYAILEGLTNDAIAEKQAITTRTVKAHISSIFQKLHVNDRVSLVLLLK
jgi:DNA-binding NarL/FixJ family response regulator